MEGQRWALIVLVVVGVILGIAIAGWPSRSSSPPLPVDSGAVTTTAPASGFAPTATTTNR